ncbi:hypothetical protein AGLY_016651 [Aphis glycines]|uniref:RRM domain-containing protein n=1 Tax=Aphis glycines TaxID=307491 RepID=A0A6G0SX97_APHGL|nr:hypothetical protein AGLY_016651 [Aphis glycines]
MTEQVDPPRRRLEVRQAKPRDFEQGQNDALKGIESAHAKFSPTNNQISLEPNDTLPRFATYSPTGSNALRSSEQIPLLKRYVNFSLTNRLYIEKGAVSQDSLPGDVHAAPPLRKYYQRSLLFRTVKPLLRTTTTHAIWRSLHGYYMHHLRATFIVIGCVYINRSLILPSCDNPKFMHGSNMQKTSTSQNAGKRTSSIALSPRNGNKNRFTPLLNLNDDSNDANTEKIDMDIEVLPEDRNLSVIIRNLPISITEAEIYEALLELNYEVTSVTRLQNRNKSPIPIVAMMSNMSGKL